MQFPVADAHCDFLYGMVNRGYSIDSLTGEQTVYLPYLSKGGVALQFFAAWIDSKLRVPYLQQCMDMVDAYYRMLDEHSDMFCPLSDHFNPSCGKIATVLTIEGGEAIEGCLSNLRIFHRLGVRAMSLTWNESNALAAGAGGDPQAGLTEAGRRAVRRMGELGMVVDVSHLNDGGFWDVMDLAAGPVIASHSNCRALCDVRRNLSDDQLRRIRDTGGVVGLNAFHGFVHAEPRQQTARTLALHAVHMAEVMGVEHVGCGFDFCEFMGPGNEGAEGLESAAHIRNLFYWLEKLGMNRQELEMVARGNFLRVLAGPDLPPQ